MDFLKKRDPSAPFFLNISFIDPHPPLTPPAPYYERYIRRASPAPAVGDWAAGFDAPQKGLHPDAWEIRLPAEELHCARAAYYGMVNFIDDQVGRLCQHARGLLDECLILFVSDHGEMLGDHNLFRKTWPYEASARIPFFARVPRNWGWPTEQVCQTPVGLQDIMPTLLEAAGLDVPATCTGRWKYVWYSQTGREHLFDLADDPQELRDLARGDAADERLRPWRERLAVVLKDRPEGFVADGALVAGRDHRPIMPDYDPHRTSNFE